MDVHFDLHLAEKYKSPVQIARVLTETWVSKNMYCPRCGALAINHFPNNAPVADFFCPVCKNQYELKSKAGKFGSKITDGAYQSMIDRILSNENPDFFFMSYSKENYTVDRLLFVPKHFFVPSLIEKRKPLSDSAQRAGWTGCNILIEKIPKQGVISIVENSVPVEEKEVIKKVKRSDLLLTENIHARGWIYDVLNIVNSISNMDFKLEDLYAYEKNLAVLHPNNINIRPKIRQQLQFLRDKGFIEFLGSGKYRKIEDDIL